MFNFDDSIDIPSNKTFNLMNNTQFNENENTLVPLSQLTNFNVESLINRASNNLNQVFPAYFDSNSSTINHDYDILRTHEANHSLS